MEKKKSWLVYFKSRKFVYSVLILVSAVIAYFFGKRIIKYYGARPSKKDRRDRFIAGAAPGFPREFSLHIPEIKDQQDKNSCVAHSVSYMMENVFWKPGEYNPFAVGFVYGYRPSGYYAGEGMYPREAMKTIQKVGNVYYRDFPYNEEVPQITNRVFNEIDSLKAKAQSNRVATYFRLRNNSEIKTCLMNYGPVSIMYPMHDEFMTPVNGRVDVNGLRRFNGYHQVTLFGWSGDYWKVVNSWGYGWGSKGTALVSMSYPWAEAWGVSSNPKASASQKKTSFLRFFRG